MTAIDTSVAIAAFAPWHAAHETARRSAARASIPAHARLEAYSVLTRIRPPNRLAADVVASLLARWFPRSKTLVPSAELLSGIVERCEHAGIEGGAVYDALVGLTATESALPLVTRDRRAARTYERLGVEFALLE